MFQTASFADSRLFEHLRSERGRRLVGVFAALLIEAILLLLLLSLSMHDKPAGQPGGVTLVDLESQSESAKDRDKPATKPSKPKPERQTQQRPDTQQPRVEQPATAQPVTPPTLQTPQAIVPTPFKLPSSGDTPRPVQNQPPKQAYGPADTGAASGLPNSARMGTLPNGQPYYAATWYREPGDSELAGYLSTATGPAWGVIACKTAPQYRVVDCIPIAEYPQGSMMNRAILAAAWQFQVRPPILGGTPQIGAWVGIKITYKLERKTQGQGY